MPKAGEESAAPRASAPAPSPQTAAISKGARADKMKPVHSTQVAYGEQELSKLALEHRKTHDMMEKGNNIAVIEYEKEGQLYTEIGVSVQNGPHAEEAAWEALHKKGIATEQVKRLYTERQPCDLPGHRCSRWIGQQFPNAEVFHSFEYGKTPASRQRGNEALQKALEREEPNMKPAEFVTKWGEKGLVTFPIHSLEDVCLPPEMKSFLTQVGLPNYDPFKITFHADTEPLPHLSDYLEDETVPEDFTRYRVLGEEYGTPLCIDEWAGGIMVSVEWDEEPRIRFVNSSVALFAEFLLLHRSLPSSEEAAEMSTQEWRRHVGSLRQQFLCVDPPALDNPDCWWAVILEQLLEF